MSGIALIVVLLLVAACFFSDSIVKAIMLARRKPVTHDFRHRRWGYNVQLVLPAATAVGLPLAPGLGKIRAVGHGAEPYEGDFLLLPEGRFRIDAIQRPGDPVDLWTADLTQAPHGK